MTIAGRALDTGHFCSQLPAPASSDFPGSGKCRLPCAQEGNENWIFYPLQSLCLLVEVMCFLPICSRLHPNYLLRKRSTMFSTSLVNTVKSDKWSASGMGGGSGHRFSLQHPACQALSLGLCMAAPTLEGRNLLFWLLVWVPAWSLCRQGPLRHNSRITFLSGSRCGIPTPI